MDSTPHPSVPAGNSAPRNPAGSSAGRAAPPPSTTGLDGMTVRELWEGLQEHFNELRKRLMIIVAVLFVTTFGSFYFAAPLISWLAKPAGGTSKLIALEVTENMGVFMRVSMLSGLILALPVVVYEILAFVLPALNENERKVFNRIAPLVTAIATLLFIGGAAFSYFVLLPVSIPFLTNFLGITTTLRLGSYLNFVTGLMFWLGVGFETPIVIYFLARLNIVTASGLLKQWRIAIVIIAIASAMITPTVDPVNMSLMMAPLIALFFISVLFARFGQKPRSES
ncbi:Sec-independent protein translocase TatC [Longilinea arvoryzae]|uniref:Sec-independent protein translocase protein TatC n=2 Tax=Longilinea arvoryzae TaxID=360412 RepID=A0A0S7BEZ0_9CHLR|nr:Sec-independent protein translocase TatC [Longilinea arvoryzae]